MNKRFFSENNTVRIVCPILVLNWLHMTSTYSSVSILRFVNAFLILGDSFHWRIESSFDNPVKHIRQICVNHGIYYHAQPSQIESLRLIHFPFFYLKNIVIYLKTVHSLATRIYHSTRHITRFSTILIISWTENDWGSGDIEPGNSQTSREINCEIGKPGRSWLFALLPQLRTCPLSFAVYFELKSSVNHTTTT
jgi:hypothetical protein